MKFFSRRIKKAFSFSDTNPLSFVVSMAFEKLPELNSFKGLGLIDIWDGIENVIPDDLEGINPKMFWAAGKLFALREISAPLAMIDLDFILWTVSLFSFPRRILKAVFVRQKR